jgi:hypothetical protein
LERPDATLNEMKEKTRTSHRPAGQSDRGYKKLMVKSAQEVVNREGWNRRGPAGAAGQRSSKEEEQVDNSNFRFGTLEDLNNIAEGAMSRSS